MRFKIFKANIDKKNSLDPYNDLIKDSAKLTPISSDLLTRNKPLIGTSTTKCVTNTQIDAHHIFPMMLFPSKHTQTILLPQPVHQDLHKLLAQCKFWQYQKVLYAENPNVPKKIAKILYKRVEGLT